VEGHFCASIITTLVTLEMVREFRRRRFGLLSPRTIGYDHICEILAYDRVGDPGTAQRARYVS
jgi:hypothetical protein